MAFPKNFPTQTPKLKPKKNLSAAQKLKKHKGKQANKTKSLHNAATDRIIKDVNKYDGPIKPSERITGVDPDTGINKVDLKRPTSLEMEIIGPGAEKLSADQRFEMVNDFIREAEEDPELLDRLNPIAQLAIEKHSQGKDIYPNRPDPTEKIDMALPEGADYIEPGDQVIPFTPKQLDEIEFGEDAANQILQNLLERNTPETEQQFGMPVVGRNAEGYTAESLWHGLTEGKGVEAFALPGYRYARGSFSDGDFSGMNYPRGSSTDQHEAKHLTLQHNANPAVRARPDIDRYAKRYIEDARIEAAAKEMGIDTNTPQWENQVPQEIIEDIQYSIPDEANITAGNYSEDIPRTTWLNNESAEGGMVSQDTLGDMSTWDHYINNSAEMMAEMANLKHKRAYENGFKARDNTYEGDMQLLDDLLKSPRSRSEEGFRKIHDALNSKERDNLQQMWYRLGENKQPNLKQALLS